MALMTEDYEDYLSKEKKKGRFNLFSVFNVPPDGNWQFGWLRDVHLTKTQTATIIFFF